MRKVVKKIMIIAFAALLIAIGINLFILPLHLLNGGIFGISLLLKYALGFKLGLTIVCINTPIYLLALSYDRAYFINGIIGMILSSAMIDLLFPLNGMVHLPIMVSAPAGGLLIGTGVGLMLRQDTSPGGIDLLALLCSKWFSINAGYIIFLADAAIILTGLFILQDQRLLFSLLTVLSVGIMASALTAFKSVDVYLK
jgi:uncharacterized membrane-anchored protein YitT (DUF2179 family)